MTDYSEPYIVVPDTANAAAVIDVFCQLLDWFRVRGVECDANELCRVLLDDDDGGNTSFASVDSLDSTTGTHNNATDDIGGNSRMPGGLLDMRSLAGPLDPAPPFVAAGPSVSSILPQAPITIPLDLNSVVDVANSHAAPTPQAPAIAPTPQAPVAALSTTTHVVAPARSTPFAVLPPVTPVPVHASYPTIPGEINTLGNSDSLMNPLRAIHTSGGVLNGMPADQKTVLNARIRLAFKLYMDPDQLAGLNVDNIIVPVRDHGMPEAQATGTIFQGPDGMVLHVDRQPNDRWYVVIKGRGFSGVCRSTTEWANVVPNVPGAVGHSAKDRASGEFAWLRAFYARQTAIL